MSDEKQMSDVDWIADWRALFASLDKHTGGVTGYAEWGSESFLEALDRLERLRGEFNGALDTIATKDMRIAALEAENAELRNIIETEREARFVPDLLDNPYVYIRRDELSQLRAQLASLSSPWIRCEEEFDGREQVWWWNRIAQRAQQVEKWTLNIGDLWQPCIPSPPEVESKRAEAT